MALSLKSMAVIAFSLPAFTLSIAQQKPVTIDLLTTTRELRPAYVPSPIALSDGEHYACIEGTAINKYSYRTGKFVTTIMDLEKIPDCDIESIDGFAFAENNEQKILIFTNSSQIYRHSFEADYFVYDTYFNQLQRVSEAGQERDAQISPDGSMVAYVKDNNIFIKKFRYNSTSAITDDGEYNKIINGAPDWVYEEEFAMLSAMDWSKDSKELAYIRFDESNVREFSFPMYCAGYYDEFATYPGAYSYKYPKAGEENSTVSVHVYNIEKRQTKKMDIGDNKNIYIPRIYWTPIEGQLAIYRLNRRQDKLDILLANSASTVCKEVITDKNKRYIDESALDNSMFLPDGQNIIYTSEEDGWNHIYLYGTNGVLKGKLTNGEFDVTEILGYDAKTKTLYYQAARTSPMNRDIYAVNIDTKKERRLSSGNGMTSVSFSGNYKYYKQIYTDLNTPPVHTINETQTGKVLYTIEDNSALKSRLQNYSIQPKEFITVPAANGTQLNAWIIKPHNFDPNKKYPILMVQYSGPGSQEVQNKFSIDWEQALSAAGYFVACVDGRGTGYRGEEFKKCTYQTLGRIESDDQIAAARHFASLPYIDESRIGIWGWSFGGFMSSLCLCRTDVFKTGISVAPVTSWRFYDTIYAERFMRTPQENISGYDNCNPLSLASQLNGHLFLIHGTADDNVHLQNQAEFVSALIREGKQFDMFTYPNKNHGIYGGNTRNHLYTMMFNWLKLNL